MRIVSLGRAALVTAMIVSSASPSFAQQPVCAPPSPNLTYLSVCKPGPGVVHNVTRLLSAFTVDHLFKPPPPPVSYTIADLIRPVAGSQLMAHEDLSDYVDGLAAISFTRLDNSTGTLKADFEDTQRDFNEEFGSDNQAARLKIQLPVHLEGGYWRAPDVLQMAFWKDHRPGFTFEFADGHVVRSHITCVSLSPGGLKIDLADEEQPGVVVSFGSCK